MVSLIPQHHYIGDNNSSNSQQEEVPNLTGVKSFLTPDLAAVDKIFRQLKEDGVLGFVSALEGVQLQNPHSIREGSACVRVWSNKESQNKRVVIFPGELFAESLIHILSNPSFRPWITEVRIANPKLGPGQKSTVDLPTKKFIQLQHDTLEQSAINRRPNSSTGTGSALALTNVPNPEVSELKKQVDELGCALRRQEGKIDKILELLEALSI